MIRSLIAKTGYYSKPDFLIVGAQKAGTSALFSILSQHPSIIPALTKEIHFFDNERIQYGEFSEYHKFFPFPHLKSAEKICFEATPNYLYHPLAANRIFNYKPELKLIFLLRNPVDRAVSAYNMYNIFSKSKSKKRREKSVSDSFLNVCKIGMRDYWFTNWFNDKYGIIRRGIYYDQMKNYFEKFPKSQLLILDYWELKNEFKATMTKIVKFLELSDFEFENHNVNTLFHSFTPDLNLLDEIHQFYNPFNQLLWDLLGYEMESFESLPGRNCSKS